MTSDAQQPLLLAIEDDVDIQRMLKLCLANHGFKLLAATTAKEGMALAASHRPVVVLLDLGLPDADGVGLIRRLHEWNTTPIIVISGRGQEAEKVRALDQGADDYLVKPFGVQELLARIRACLRRAQQAPGASLEPIFALGELRVDFSARRVYHAGKAVHLTPIEYRLLSLLIRHVGKVVRQQQLLAEIWGSARQQQTHYLRIYMHQLRRKLESDPVRPRYLVTEAGVGYRLTDRQLDHKMVSTR